MPPPSRLDLSKLDLTVVQEGARVMRICNACRYCEGFCAVFPAIERRLHFSDHDLSYLANLCHDCGECYSSCQYAPPHEFAVNVPQTFAAIRRHTYRQYAWPAVFGALFGRNGLTLLVSAVVLPVLFVLWLAVVVGRSTMFSAHADGDGAFYAVLSHTAMVELFGTLGLLISVIFLAGLLRFWRDTGEPLSSLADFRTVTRAAADALTLRYLDNGGAGCAYGDDVPSRARRRYHHLTFYGFTLCFASTSVAALYHNVLGWKAPYELLSVPVVLGCVGGAGLLVGPLGLLRLKMIRRSEASDHPQTAMDVVFLAMLVLTSLTGFLLLALREAPAMGPLLGIHLGIVMGLFVTLPYGKFVHGIYRFCALLLNALEVSRYRGAKLVEMEERERE